MSANTALIRNGVRLFWLLLALVTAGAGCQTAQDPAGVVMGGARVQSETPSGLGPSGPPRTVYVEDFSLDYQNLQTDEGVRGRVGALQRVPRLRS